MNSCWKSSHTKVAAFGCHLAFQRQHLVCQSQRSVLFQNSTKKLRRGYLTSLQAEAPSAETLQATKPSFKPAAPADWPKLQHLLQENETVTIQIDSLRKTGAVFHLHGAEGFIYFDAIAYTRVVGRAPADLVGKQLDVKIILAEENGRGLRASELARLTQEKAAQMTVGDVVEGVVSHCTDFGAFVRIGDGKDLSPVEQMSPDPLKEQLETLLPEGGKEQIASVPTSVSQGIEKILAALRQQNGVNEVTLGRQVEERAVSQELEIWMTTADVQQEQFTLIVREGRTVQEISVSAAISKEDMKEIMQKILQAFG